MECTNITQLCMCYTHLAVVMEQAKPTNTLFLERLLQQNAGIAGKAFPSFPASLFNLWTDLVCWRLNGGHSKLMSYADFRV